MDIDGDSISTEGEMDAVAAEASLKEEEERGTEVSGENVERERVGFEEGDGKTAETEDEQEMVEEKESSGMETTAGASASEQRCPVCLGDYQNKAFIDACFHILQRPLSVQA